MMMLGVVLHTALVYMPEGWIYTDSDPVKWSPLLVWLIHIFRMSTFFVMAGFFGAMLYERRGAIMFARHRLDRIGVPLVVGWFVLFPLLSWSIIFAWTFTTVDPARTGGFLESVRLAWERMPVETDWGEAGTGHLWFLYDLLWFYAAAAILASAVDRIPPIRATMDRIGHALLIGPGRFATPALLILLSFGLMLGMEEPGIDTSDSWYPDWHLMLTYLVPFGVGWLAWRHRGVVDELERWCWWLLAASIPLLAAATLATLAWWAEEQDRTVFVITQFLSAAASWTTVLALAGCCERLLKRERFWIRYLVDASYWIYLAHLPLTIFVPALLRHWDVPGALKMSVSIVVTFLVLLATYHVLVRGTILGVVLSGRRYPVLWFRRNREEEPAVSE